MMVAIVEEFKSSNNDRVTNAALEPLSEHMLRDIGLEWLDVNPIVADPDNYNSRLRVYVERDAAGNFKIGGTSGRGIDRSSIHDLARDNQGVLT